MSRYNRTDLKLTPDGDLALTASGDLAVVDRLAYQVQQTICRVKSITVDWLYDHIGADLEDLLGWENTRATADELRSRVTKALTSDGFLNADEVYIEVVPVDRGKLVAFLFINSPYAAEPQGFEIELDLASGATIRAI